LKRLVTKIDLHFLLSPDRFAKRVFDLEYRE